MTVAAKNPIEVYDGDGVTTAFAARWRYLDGASLKVELISGDGVATLQTLGVHFTATAGATDAGGTVTMVTAPATGQRLRIKRVTPRAQPTQYPTSGAFPASSHELALDRTMMAVQETAVDLGDVQTRALQVPFGETAPELPKASARKSKIFAFDASGRGVFDIDADKVRDIIAAVFNPIFTSLASLVMFLVAGAGGLARSVQDKLRERVSIYDFGAIGDGTLHPVSEWIGAGKRYASLAALQVDYPHVTATTDSIDWAAFMAAKTYCLASTKEMYLGEGVFYFNRSCDLTFAGGVGSNYNMFRGITIRGKSRVHTQIIGATAGLPIFDMVGARLCVFSDFQVRYDANDANAPSCAFLMARNTNNSGAGEHILHRIGTFGYFTKTAVAEISSEVNAFYDSVFVNQHPDGHCGYISSQNGIGITSAYVPGVLGHAFSGGNTRHVYTNCAWNHFAGVTTGTGRALFLSNDAASPTTNLLFSGCYSITEPKENPESISLNGNLRDIVFINHRDESSALATQAGSIVIKAGATVTGLRVVGGQFSRMMFGEDGSKISRSQLAPEQLTTGFSVSGTFLSMDLYDATDTVIGSPGNNGLRIRNDATRSELIEPVSSANLVLGGTDTQKAGFKARYRDVAGIVWDADFSTKSRFVRQRVSANALTVGPQDITTTGAFSINLDSGSSATVRLTGNVTINGVSNIKPATGDKYGSLFLVTFIQDATGGRTVSWGAQFDLGGAAVAGGANAITTFLFVHVDPDGTGVSSKYVRVR